MHHGIFKIKLNKGHKKNAEEPRVNMLKDIRRYFFFTMARLILCANTQHISGVFVYIKISECSLISSMGGIDAQRLCILLLSSFSFSLFAYICLYFIRIHFDSLLLFVCYA